MTGPLWLIWPMSWHIATYIAVPCYKQYPTKTQEKAKLVILGA